MTKMEYLLCQKIKAGEIHDWRALPNAEQRMLIAMKERKWIWLDQAGAVLLEPAGYAALQAHEEELERLEKEAEQQAQETAKQDREKAADIRRSWVQFGLGLLLGWILGGFTFDEAVRFILKVHEIVAGLFQ